MSKERELLKKILNTGWLNHELSCEVEELLAQPEQEPVFWMYEWINEIGEIVKGVYVGSHKASHLYELANLEPLYTAPPEREPLTPQQISEGNQSMLNVTRDAFVKGVKFAEKMHGIGGGE
jgi:hypothetical protein